MPSLQILQGSFRLNDIRTLTLDDVAIHTGESWAFVGANGSGKSALARSPAGKLTVSAGERRTDYQRIARLSLEQVQRLVEEEWQRANTDLLSPGEEDTGSTAAEIIQQQEADDERCQHFASQFGIRHLLTRRFKYLSTGESRKVLLCQALMAHADLLILDEPFDGLDVASRQQLSERLAGLAGSACTLVLILSRFEDIPAYIDRVDILVDCALTCTRLPPKPAGGGAGGATGPFGIFAGSGAAGSRPAATAGLAAGGPAAYQFA